MERANMTALTDLQREQWAVDGYLQLEGVLSPAEVDFFSDQIDRVRMLPGYEPSRETMPPPICSSSHGYVGAVPFTTSESLYGCPDSMNSA